MTFYLRVSLKFLNDTPSPGSQIVSRSGYWKQDIMSSKWPHILDIIYIGKVWFVKILVVTVCSSSSLTFTMSYCCITFHPLSSEATKLISTETSVMQFALIALSHPLQRGNSFRMSHQLTVWRLWPACSSPQTVWLGCALIRNNLQSM